MTSSLECESDLVTLAITEEDLTQFRRLDQLISQRLPDISRTFLKKIFEQGLVSCETETLDLRKIPAPGTLITIALPPPIPSDAKPENIALDILYQDDHLVLVNKPAGLVTHPGAGNPAGTLVNAILHHCPDMQREGQRPGIVHRLDKGTSGIMVIAKTRVCHERLVLLFSERKMQRVYQALVLKENILPYGRLEAAIGRHPRHRIKMSTKGRHGRHAVTHYKILKQFPSFSHLELKLETGRTHQIRVHLSELLKAPILRDALYGNKAKEISQIPPSLYHLIADYPHPLLHAGLLGFIHPMTKKELEFSVSPPEVFSKFLDEAHHA